MSWTNTSKCYIVYILNTYSIFASVSFVIHLYIVSVIHVSICLSLHPLIHSLATYLESGSLWQRSQWNIPGDLFPSSFRQHLHQALPCPLGDVVPAVCPGSVLGSSPIQRFLIFDCNHIIIFGHSLKVSVKWKLNKGFMLQLSLQHLSPVRWLHYCSWCTSVLPTFINNETLTYLNSSTWGSCFPLTWIGLNTFLWREFLASV